MIETVRDAKAGDRDSRSCSRDGDAKARSPWSRIIPIGRPSASIDEALIDRLDELDPQHPGASDRASLVARLGRLASLEAPGTDARAAKNHWVALRKLGEIIALLGQAARFFRKNAGPASSVH